MNPLVFFFILFFFSLPNTYGYTCNSKANELMDRYKTATFTLPNDPLLISGACYNLTDYAHSPFLANHMVMLIYHHQDNLYYTGHFSMLSKANPFKNLNLERFGRLTSKRQNDKNIPFDIEDYLQEVVETGFKAVFPTEREISLCNADKIEKKKICQTAKNLTKKESAFCQTTDEDQEKLKKIDLCIVDKITEKQVLWSVGGFSYQRLGFDSQNRPIFVFTSVREMFHCELVPHPITDSQGEVDRSCQP